MSSNNLKEQAARYVGALRRIRNDRGKLAALRRGLSSSTVMDAWPVVHGLGGQIGQAGESVHVDLAALYALHPEEAPVRNFGETCRQIALESSSDKTIPESFERRFRRLIASNSREDLIGQLRSWVRLAAAKGKGVNYESLFFDLCCWPRYADDIRVRWAQSFWYSGVEASAEETSKAA